MPDPVAPGNPVPAAEVRTMFDRIAPIYDTMNTVMTAGLDARWRRAAAAATQLGRGGAALDVACGSGALTVELARLAGPDGRVTGVDVSEPMLARARRRPRSSNAADPAYVRGDAMALPMPDSAVDAVTIGFGLRNVADYAACLREMARVTRPGGRIVVLEIATPERGVGRLLGATWFERVVPVLGRLVGGGTAYRYLPASVRTYPPPAAIARAMADSGVEDVRWRRLRPGLVTLHVGRKAAS
ncbi:MAG TPA: ubiquinone/menaquinone biosynthesis methyltransferase [Candidatus Limnocylindrales bacterium]|nr:ubiquinone/menaquinone biosynthesis methyltransferase [Candidatus Limnocylindrales bacterium]